MTSRTGVTENDYLFTGEQYDANVAFYYLRARYMNPTLGRFLTMDSWGGIITDPISLHKYLYANCDPVNNIDPSGNYTLVGVLTAVQIVHHCFIEYLRLRALSAVVKKVSVYDIWLRYAQKMCGLRRCRNWHWCSDWEWELRHSKRTICRTVLISTIMSLWSLTNR